MKKYGKWISVLLVLALAAGLFGGMTVWAEDAGTQPLTATDPAQSGSNDSSSTPTATPTVTPTPTPAVEPPDPDEGEPSLTNYVIVGAGESTLAKRQPFSLELSIHDPRQSAWGKNVTATVNCSAFYFPQPSVGGTCGADGQYTLRLDGLMYLGGTPELVLDISYPGTSLPVKQISLTLNQCVDTPDPTPTPEPTPTMAPEPTKEPTYKTPGLIIKQSSFGSEPQVQAGAEFILTLTVFATTGTENLTDVLVTLELPKDVSLATGNLNTYLGEVGPEGTRTVTYQIIPSATFVDGVANIGVSMSGVGKVTGAASSGSTTVSVPVVQPERFEITNIEAPETMMMGEEGYVSITFVNKGKTPVSNLSAEIMGTNLANPGQSQFLGNIAAGTENSVDFNVMAEQAGLLTATVVLSYEDDAGNVKTLQKDFSCTIEEMPVFDDPGMMDPGMMDPTMGEEPKAGMPWWGWLLIVAALGGGAAVVVVVLKKRKAQKALAQLEEQDEDL